MLGVVVVLVTCHNVLLRAVTECRLHVNHNKVLFNLSKQPQHQPLLKTRQDYFELYKMAIKIGLKYL